LEKKNGREKKILGWSLGVRNQRKVIHRSQYLGSGRGKGPHHVKSGSKRDMPAYPPAVQFVGEEVRRAD